MDHDEGNAKLNAARLEAVLRGPELPKVPQKRDWMGDVAAINAASAKTARLRALRLAKEEADRVVAEQSPKPPPKKKTVKPAVKKAR